MVKLEFFCAIVGVGSVFEVNIDDGASVAALKKAIKKENKIKLKDIDAGDLQLFLAKKDGAWLQSEDLLQMWEKKTPGEYERGYMIEELKNPVAKIREKFLSEVPYGSIHVLVVVPNRTFTSLWTLAIKPCPVLSFLEANSIIHIPEEYAQGSGLSVDEDGLYLYLRPELKEEWAALHENVVETYAAQWIVGPPGTGKSCAAFAFACSTKRDGNWDIVWIHCSNALGNPLLCILFRGASEKFTCEIGRPQLSSLLLSLNENAMLFLDGYVKARDERSVLEVCGLWHSANKQNHRVVVVSSMVSMGKDYRPGQYNKISSIFESSLENLAISRSTVSKGTSSKKNDQQRFMLPSWTPEDYKKALADDVFFEHVRSKFTASDGDVKLEERYELLDAKFFVAGGSARMMFDMSFEEAMGLLRSSILNVGDITQYIDGSIGGCSNSVVNQLLSWYDYDPLHACLVSMFVAREFTFRLGPQKLLRLAKCLVQKPAMDGHVFEMWFFASLMHGGAHCHIYQDGNLEEVVWKAENEYTSATRYQNVSSWTCPVKRFDPHGVIPLNQREQWLAPIPWNQGGYDAVYIESLELNTDEADVNASNAGFTQKMLVRFVQVTRSTTHSFKVRFFKELLTRLVVSLKDSLWIYAVEVCFVVPREVMSEFRLPTNDKDFTREALTAFVSDLPTISIQVLGLDYISFDEEKVDVGQKRRRS